MTTHTLRRALAALAACAIAATGVALTPITAHAATGPSVYVADADRATALGQPVRFTATGFPADTKVLISLTYRNGTSSGGQQIHDKPSDPVLRTDAAGRLINASVTVPSDLPTIFFSTTAATVDTVHVATSDDSAQANDIIRISATLPSVTVAKPVAAPGEKLHMHVTGLWPGEDAVADVEQTVWPYASVVVGELADGTQQRWTADTHGVIDADITVPDPRIDEYADVDQLLDSATTVLDVTSLGANRVPNIYGVTSATALRLNEAVVVSPPASPPNPPATCPRPTVKGGPLICVYGGGDSYSGHPGDTAYVAGYRWSPGSTVTLWATQGCTIDVQGRTPDPATCTINGGLSQWDVGTDAVEIGTVTVATDGSIAAQPVTLPALPASWYSRGVTVVAVGRHTAVYPFAENQMGASTNGFVWLAPAPLPDPTPTPTPSPTPTDPTPAPTSPTTTPGPTTTPSPTPTDPTPAPTSPTPSPTSPTPRRSTTPPPPKTHTPTAKPTPSKAIGPPLASTGAPSEGLLRWGALLLAGGALAIFAGRKRREPKHRA